MQGQFQSFPSHIRRVAVSEAPEGRKSGKVWFCMREQHSIGVFHGEVLQVDSLRIVGASVWP